MTVLLLLATLAAHAQEEEAGKRLQYWEWVTLRNVTPLRDEVMQEIEELTRIRFRRPVGVEIASRHDWEARTKREGYEGHVSQHSSAFYSPGRNVITFQPWAVSWMATAEDWRTIARQTMLHELAHALHFQNFYTEGGEWAASLRASHLTEHEIDRSTVDFLVTEGFAELVSYSLSLKRARDLIEARKLDSSEQALWNLGRRPERRPEPLKAYMDRYVPQGKEAYRIHLYNHGYGDGLTCLYHLMLGGGMRAVRSVLYRNPHRMLLFAPDLLAEAELDDPPEPDAIFRFLHPGELSEEGVLFATNPGRNRLFERAARGHARGCLLGYVARASKGKYAGSRYAFFLSDPDDPGSWQKEQLDFLLGLAKSGGGARVRTTALPLAKKRDKAVLTRFPMRGGAVVHGRVEGIVVLVREAATTKTVEERVLTALRALLIKRPKPGVFSDALAKARVRLNG